MFGFVWAFNYSVSFIIHEVLFTSNIEICTSFNIKNRLIDFQDSETLQLA